MIDELHAHPNRGVVDRLLATRRDWNGRRRDWAGRCAFVLACGSSVGWCGALLVAAFKTEPISTQGAHLLATLGGAMAGAVATYLGSTLHQTATDSRRGTPAAPAPEPHAPAGG